MQESLERFGNDIRYTTSARLLWLHARLGDIANSGAVLSTPQLQSTYGTRTDLRSIAMSIDAINGTVSLVMPKYDWHEQRVAGNGLAARPLNGNGLIGAYSNPGDGGQ